MCSHVVHRHGRLVLVVLLMVLSFALGAMGCGDETAPAPSTPTTMDMRVPIPYCAVEPDHPGGPEGTSCTVGAVCADVDVSCECPGGSWVCHYAHAADMSGGRD
jgi:hypothetical protein